MKYFRFLILSFFMFTSFQTAEKGKGDKDFPDVIYPRYRIWTTPSAGEEPEFNPPSLEWPSKKKAKYSVRLSSSKDFSTDLIEKDEIPFSIRIKFWIKENGTGNIKSKEENGIKLILF
jgi:hypothetical protein